MGRHGVNVNSIAPGTFPIGMNDPQVPRTLVQKAGSILSSLIPLRRLGSENDLAGTFLYFASAASKYCTGQILAVDGGFGAKSKDVQNTFVCNRTNYRIAC
ncbi:SDR family oxidoreductase [Brevibacillus fortis]|uniref:SDR family oxidoreductase n=1 Tax=Brevibacillus fortis TaxID=2126352 RepID=UPI0038FCAE5F